MRQNSTEYENVVQEIKALAKVSKKPNEELVCKVYKRRWIMLGLYVGFAFVNNMQWIQYAIINNLVMKYYNVGSVAVDWTSIIFMAGFIPLIFPAMYLLEKKGLKWTIFLGTLGTAVGSCIKAFSVSPDRFWGALLGQSFVGSSQVFLLGIPPNLAAVWFGSDQVSTACSIGVFGNLLGVAVGFLMPPVFVRNHDNVEDIGSDLSLMFNCTAGISIFLLVLIVAFFQAEPSLPPSPEQALKRGSKEETNFLIGVKNLLINRGFLLLVFTYATAVAALNSFSTLLNQLILPYFPGGERFAGQVGLMFIIGGMVGSVVLGVVLDKTHKYKETAVASYAFSIVCMLAFSFTLGLKSHIAVFITVFFLGCFLAGYMPVGFELGSEITYPEPEGTTAGLVILTTQIVSVFHAMAYSELVRTLGDLWANIIMSGTLFVGTVLTALIPPDLRRQEAHKTSHQ
ncbi:hypothetical protein L9F63_003152 [Diploptera punctata]|uniref:Major facilitator superfamily (MFS) profile domain-containing protein n=1 Tax=Diploptera punctata TaxID=6984 RepID=A0AAD7ZKL7_DIPPU|nr:hypothetical protein L9F63_003152 [Diploptera punctata]